MAMYEFVCQKCNQEFEQLVFSGEIAACPGCKSTRLEKKWSLPSRLGNQHAKRIRTALTPPEAPKHTA